MFCLFVDGPLTVGRVLYTQRVALPWEVCRIAWTEPKPPRALAGNWGRRGWPGS